MFCIFNLSSRKKRSCSFVYKNSLLTCNSISIFQQGFSVYECIILQLLYRLHLFRRIVGILVVLSLCYQTDIYDRHHRHCAYFCMMCRKCIVGFPDYWWDVFSLGNVKHLLIFCWWVENYVLVYKNTMPQTK